MSERGEEEEESTTSLKIPKCKITRVWMERWREKEDNGQT